MRYVSGSPVAVRKLPPKVSADDLAGPLIKAVEEWRKRYPERARTYDTDTTDAGVREDVDPRDDAADEWLAIEYAISTGTYTDNLLTAALLSKKEAPLDVALLVEGYMRQRHADGAKHDEKNLRRQRKLRAAQYVELETRLAPGQYEAAMKNAKEHWGIGHSTIDALRHALWTKPNSKK